MVVHTCTIAQYHDSRAIAHSMTSLPWEGYRHRGLAGPAPEGGTCPTELGVIPRRGQPGRAVRIPPHHGPCSNSERAGLYRDPDGCQSSELRAAGHMVTAHRSRPPRIVRGQRGRGAGRLAVLRHDQRRRGRALHLDLDLYRRRLPGRMASLGQTWRAPAWQLSDARCRPCAVESDSEARMHASESRPRARALRCTVRSLKRKRP
jgi:hypothetical protein